MIKCIVPISGGKDSQACLKLALQQFDKSEIIGLFCDTKFEKTCLICLTDTSPPSAGF